MADENKIIWTIGHSTRSQEEFLTVLQSFNIQALVDVRRYPGSKKYPHFNASAMQLWLPEVSIQYLPEEKLGGRRNPKPDSKNTIWRHKAFRGYADYTETNSFEAGIMELMKMAVTKRTVYMCSEAVWWRCHRAIISDYLKSKGWQVMHIMKEGEAKEHPFTSAYLQTKTG